MVHVTVFLFNEKRFVHREIRLLILFLIQYENFFFSYYQFIVLCKIIIGQLD